MSKHHGEHSHGKHGAKSSSPGLGGKHKTWLVVVVILMLIGMAIYILTDDEAIRPEPIEEPAAQQPIE